MQVLGYVRVSSPSQAESGAGIDAQRAAIEAECGRRGWSLEDIVEDAGFSGLVFTEMSQPPWISIVAAHEAAPNLQLATGIAVAFPRSPMLTAQTAWELAEATNGHFRLGLGSQVRAHIERRYGVAFAYCTVLTVIVLAGFALIRLLVGRTATLHRIAERQER